MKKNSFVDSKSIRASAVRIALLLFFLSAYSHGQTYFNQPESAVHDSKGNRYLISNAGDGNIIQVNTIDHSERIDTPQIVFEHFNTELSSVRGMHIVGDVLFVASDAGVVGFDLATAQKTMTVVISEAKFLNDITSDPKGYLYVTDSNTNKIFKVRISDQTYTVLVDTGLTNPNGIFFDEKNGRLLVCAFKFKGPIYVIDPDTGAIVYTYATNLHNLDGITMDELGTIYVSSWGTQSIYRIDGGLSEPPEQISKGYNGPADIYFDKENNLLVIPNLNIDKIDYLIIHPLIRSPF